MTPILTAAQMRQADRRAIEEHMIPGLVLMENAARGSCDILATLLGGLRGKRIALLCGRGNNGGDGLGVARHALIAGADVHCVLLNAPHELSADAAAQYAMLTSFAPERVLSWERFQSLAGQYDAIVDALLGTGSTGAPRSPVADAVRWANAQESLRYALDIPTGADADTGIAAGDILHADATATMAALKPGLLLGDGARASGRIFVVNIGTPPALYGDSSLALLDTRRGAEALPAIRTTRHKYDRGNVLVAAGSRGMTGAAVMAAEAALRAGAGLTVLALPEEAGVALPQRLSPEIMTRLLPSADGAFQEHAFDAILQDSRTYSAIAIGPGISRNEQALRAVRALIAKTSAPVVLDADGLSAFTGATDLLAHRTGGLVITPHHGEMARLLGIDSQEIGRDTIGYAREAARRMHCIAVLKGAPTVVALPDGRAWINGAGNPGMASGGTGDVLTGIIASLIGQTGDLVEGTLAGVLLHSVAGDLAALSHGVRSMTATDIIMHLPDAYISLHDR